MRYFFSLFLKMLAELIPLTSDGILFQIPIDSNINDCWNLLLWQYGKLMLPCTTKRVWCPCWGLNSSMKDFISGLAVEFKYLWNLRDTQNANIFSKFNILFLIKNSLSSWSGNSLKALFCSPLILFMLPTPEEPQTHIPYSKWGCTREKYKVLIMDLGMKKRTLLIAPIADETFLHNLFTWALKLSRLSIITPRNFDSVTFTKGLFQISIDGKFWDELLISCN